MERIIYDRGLSANGSILDRDSYVIVKKKASLKHRIFLSPVVKYVVPTLAAVCFLTAIIYLAIYIGLSSTDEAWISTCNIRASYRVNCFPGRSTVSYEECNAADCCWNDEDKFCFHSVPSGHGYTKSGDSSAYQENDVLIPRRATSPFGKKNADSLTFHLVQHSEPNHIEFSLKIGAARTRRKRNIDRLGETLVDPIFGEDASMGTNLSENDLSEKLLNFLPRNAARRTSNVQTHAESKMDVYVHTPEFSVTVTPKNDTSRSLLSTARGPLILTENYWELTLFITNNTLYGLNQQELNGTINWIYDNENSTSRPAFLGVHANGEGTACYVRHDGPMEIQVIDESNLIILRGLSLPSEISIHVFAGPTPLEAIAQLTKALQDYRDEINPIEPSSQGLHVCPEAETDSPIDSMTNVIKALKATPWDSHCIHRDFDPTLGNTVNRSIIDNAITLLTDDNKERTIFPHLSPMVFADNALSSKLDEESLLLKTSLRSYRGSYRNHGACYPDWHDVKTQNVSLSFLAMYMENFRKPKLIYLRDSWPKDETKGHEIPSDPIFDYAPQALQNSMSEATVPYTLISPTRGKSHYTEHAAYSKLFASFVGQRNESRNSVIRGLWGESGDSSWSSLEAAIRVGVGSGIVGQLPSPMYACGSGERSGSAASSDELCSRWYGASVAWPYVLAVPENLPGGELTATSSSYVIKHLELRASLVSYARTLLVQHYDEGLPLLSPTFLHYPRDLDARYKWNQFMWGNDVLIGLVTLPGVSQVSMWIPGPYAWRHLETGLKVEPTMGETVSITANENQIVTLIRPGSIVPVHRKITLTSASTLKSDLTLLVNLACDDCAAYGKLFYGMNVNDGVFLSINATRTSLKFDNLSQVKEKFCDVSGTKISQQGTKFDKVVFYGYKEVPLNKDLCTMADVEIML